MAGALREVNGRSVCTIGSIIPVLAIYIGLALVKIETVGEGTETTMLEESKPYTRQMKARHTPHHISWSLKCSRLSDSKCTLITWRFEWVFDFLLDRHLIKLVPDQIHLIRESLKQILKTVCLMFLFPFGGAGLLWLFKESSSKKCNVSLSAGISSVLR